MAKAYFRVNGVEFLPFIEAGKLKFSLTDVDSPDAGRTLDAEMHRGKVAEKAKYEAQCIPLSTIESRIILRTLLNEYITVETNIDPLDGTVTRTMYNSSRSATCWTVDPETGIGKWTEFAFSLIEV